MTYVERKAREFDVNTIMDGDPLEALISSVISDCALIAERICNDEDAEQVDLREIHLRIRALTAPTTTEEP